MLAAAGNAGRESGGKTNSISIRSIGTGFFNKPFTVSAASLMWPNLFQGYGAL